MAFWQRRDEKVKVYFWDSQSGRQRVLPRAQTAHLDQEDDGSIERWVSTWTRLHSARQQLRTHTGPEVAQLVERFLSHTRTLEGRHPDTINQHRRHLLVYALPFFSTHLGLTLKEYPDHSRNLVDWLTGPMRASPRKVRKVNQSLSKFWRWLIEEGIAERSLLLRNLHIPTRPTPLKFVVEPDVVLKWPGRNHLKLLALICYFFSLRPQEALGLTPRDFVAGEDVAEAEAYRVMVGAGLFGQLAVNVERQKSKLLGLTPPKLHSVGLVACFDERAARMLVEHLNQLPLDEPLFPYGVDTYQHQWKRYGIPGVTLKDLRRASLYYLGHHTRLPLAALKNHARHRNVETTMLYTRRPSDRIKRRGGRLEL